MNEDDNNDNQRPKKGFIFWLSQLFQGEPKNRDELVELIRDSELNDLIDPETRNMLEGVMDITELRVRDIMIPRTQMITLNIDQRLDECIHIIIENGHSRYPVISEDKDHIEGILLAKDLLIFMNKPTEQFCLENILRSAVVVPESKRVDQMLKEFRSKRYHMAIVIDEFGGVSGLVTIEDILELIVGDIEDEYDDEEVPDIRKVSETEYSVSALTPIEEFNERFELNFSDDDVDTLGGLVMQTLGHLPVKGECVIIDNIQFKVTAADSRRIIQLQVIFLDFVTPPSVDEK